MGRSVLTTRCPSKARIHPVQVLAALNPENRRTAGIHVAPTMKPNASPPTSLQALPENQPAKPPSFRPDSKFGAEHLDGL